MNAIIFSAIFGVVMMFVSISTNKTKLIQCYATALLALLLLLNILQTYGSFSIKLDAVGNTLSFSQFGYFFNTIAIALTLLYVWLNGDAISKVGKHSAEYFALIFFSLCGVTILSSFNGLLMFFLGIEIMSLPLYILTGADKSNLKSNEAALKYFLMGAFFTAIMLMGIALVYGGSGNFTLDASAPPTPVLGRGIIAIIVAPVGLLLIFFALCFKVAAAPFHFWAPDVYDGAPSVFTSFMMSVIKVAGFIAFFRIFISKGDDLGYSWKLIVFTVIVLTLLVGNITAVFQQSVKRMLAYSSIAQAGFILLALYGRKSTGAVEGVLFYSIAYGLATIGNFAVLIKIKDYTISGYSGLAKKQPLLAAANTVFFMSLAGIPLTAGFLAKYYLLAAVAQTGGWGLIIIAVVLSAISVYYYFRVIQAMYFKEGNPEVAPISVSFKIGLLVIVALIILLGILPYSLLQYLYF